MRETPDQLSVAGRINRNILLSDVFAEERIQVDVHVASQKRMLEVLSILFAENMRYDLSKNTVFHTLLKRERIGSTCVGNGVALPHGRLSELTEAVGAIVRMATPLKLDAIDNKPVILACGLLVPTNCAEVHINILARLAGGFEQGDLRHRMLNAKTAKQIFDQIVEYESGTALD